METFHARFAPFPYHPPRALRRARVTDFTAIVTIRPVVFFFSLFLFLSRGGQVNLERWGVIDD